MSFCGKDLDDLFAYETVRMVRIRDRKLGFLYYMGLGAVLLYVLGYVIFYEQKYLETQAPTGSIRLLLLGDTKYSADSPYCREDGPYQKQDCRIWDEHDIRYPNTDSNVLLVTTRVQEFHQKRQCDDDAQVCDYSSPFQTTKQADFFISGIERFYLQLSHSVQAPTFYSDTREERYRGISTDMQGQVIVNNKESIGRDKIVKRFPNGRQYDIVTIPELLNYTGFDLDKPLPGQRETIRQTGGVIFCHIRYTNSWNWFAPADSIRYSYEFLPGVDTSSNYVPLYGNEDYDQGRVLQIRSGLKIVFMQEGLLGRFSFPTLLLSLVTGLGLITGIKVVVDLAATRFMRLKDFYYSHKYIVTKDYSDTHDRLDHLNDEEMKRLLAEHKYT